MPLHKRLVFARLILRCMELVLCCADCACSQYFLVRSDPVRVLTIPYNVALILHFVDVQIRAETNANTKVQYVTLKSLRFVYLKRW